MKQRLRLARGEGFANEGTEIFIVADGGGEEKLIKLLRGVAVGGRRGHFAAHFRRLHRCLTVGDGEGAVAVSLWVSLGNFLGLFDFLETDVSWFETQTQVPEYPPVSAVLIREILLVMKFGEAVCNGDAQYVCMTSR